MSDPGGTTNGAARRNGQPVIGMVQLSLHVGGAEVLAARMARRFARDYRVVAVCLDDLGPLGEALRDEGFPVHIVGRRPGIDPSCARRLAGIFRQEQVDLVHAHHYGPFFYSALSRLPGRRPPIVLTEHGRPFPDPTNPTTHRMANLALLRRGDRLVAVGRDVRRALIEKEGFPASRIEVVYNGIDLSAFDEPGRDRHQTRDELGLAPDDLVLIQVARLDPLKDHAMTLRALARLVQQPEHRAIRLLIVGDGPEADALAEQVRALGLEPFVRLLGRRGDVPRLLGASDVALLTSRSEGIPLAIIEAMAAGLPVVATRVGGTPEVVEEDRTGLLVAAEADDELARQIARLAASPALRRELGSQGRRRAFDQFSEDQMICCYKKIYNEMISNPRRRIEV
jgi:glycosyltransferase involved in cell wall biosynthesis